MQKTLYEVDPFNRLIINSAGKKGGLKKFRRVLDGEFRIGAGNDLSYHIKSPASGEDTPHQIRLRGEWSLTSDHLLRLTLDNECRDTFGDEITLQGQILDVDKNSLTFSAMTRSKDDIESMYILNLAGVWKADKYNRLSFCVEKEGGKYDILTFSGVWEIDRHNKIIYKYEKAALVRKKSQSRTLIFEGYWDIKKKLRISYRFDENSESGFDFGAALGVLKDGLIKYEVGISLDNDTEPVKRIVILSGAWKLKKDAGLFFEVEYGQNGVRAIVFGADARLTKDSTVAFRLRDRLAGNDLGMTLELSQKMLDGDGELFLRALTSKGEAALYAGAAWRF